LTFKVALEFGAFTASQLMHLSGYTEQMVELVEKIPYCVNIRDSGTGDTLLHLCAREGNIDAVRSILGSGGATYTPIENSSRVILPGDEGQYDHNITALDLAIESQYPDVAKVPHYMFQPLVELYVGCMAVLKVSRCGIDAAKELWSHLTTSLNQQTAVHMTTTLARPRRGYSAILPPSVLVCMENPYKRSRQQ
jgi:hypothetical protein